VGDHVASAIRLLSLYGLSFFILSPVADLAAGDFSPRAVILYFNAA